MRTRNFWIAVTVAAIGAACSTQSLKAADLQISAQVASDAKVSVPASATFPGYVIGIIGAGYTVSGLPTFPGPGELEIPTPISLLPSGQPIQYYFTLETAGVSGDLSVDLQVIQNGVSIYAITGVLSFGAATETVVSTNNAIVPASPGPAEIMVTVSNGAVSTSQGTRVIIK